MSDWRSGKLLGAGVAIVLNGRVVATAPDRTKLQAMWSRVGAKELPVLPDDYIREVCFVLPPWEKP